MNKPPDPDPLPHSVILPPRPAVPVPCNFSKGLHLLTPLACPVWFSSSHHNLAWSIFHRPAMAWLSSMPLSGTLPDPYRATLILISPPLPAAPDFCGFMKGADHFVSLDWFLGIHHDLAWLTCLGVFGAMLMPGKVRSHRHFIRQHSSFPARKGNSSCDGCVLGGSFLSHYNDFHPCDDASPRRIWIRGFAKFFSLASVLVCPSPSSLVVYFLFSQTVLYGVIRHVVLFQVSVSSVCPYFWVSGGWPLSLPPKTFLLSDPEDHLPWLCANPVLSLFLDFFLS